MKNSEKKEEDPVKKPDQSSDSSSSDIEKKGKLFPWVDAGVKVVIALVGIVVTIIGYNYQRSFTTSQLLVQQEKGDTEIRAQMFSKITDRLMKPAEKGERSLVQDVLLAQMLALNFHELIELKPLMIDLDEQLSNEIEKIQKTNADNPELEIMKNARESLRSVARRICKRQVASLINSPRPEKDAVIPKGAGSIKYISIRRKGKQSENRCFTREKDGENACLGELVMFPGFKEGQAMYLTIDSADWKKERFVVSLNCGKATPEIVLPPGEEVIDVDECREGLTEDIGKKEQSPVAPGHRYFEVSWFDFPLTDNTLQADGNRYAVFIDQVCKDANAKPEDEPNAVRLGLLYFPKDYYPSRERPVSYKQLNDKLGLSWRETNSK